MRDFKDSDRNPKNRNRRDRDGNFPAGRKLILAAAAGLPLLGSSRGLFAQVASGTWTQTTSGGLWSNTANWSNGAVASGAGTTANFTTNSLSAPQTVHLDTSFTIGQLAFGGSGNQGWTIDNNGNSTNILTLDNSGSTPTITVSRPIMATIGAVLAGSNGLNITDIDTSSNTSGLTLSAANTFTGNVTFTTSSTSINTGSPSGLVVTNVNALGAATSPQTITLVANGSSARAELDLDTSGNATYSSNYNLVLQGGTSRAQLYSYVGNTVWNGNITLDGTGGNSSSGDEIYNLAGGTVLTINGNISTANGFSGALTLRSGVIQVNGTLNIGTSLLGSAGATIILNGSNDIFAPGTGTYQIGNGTTTGSLGGNMAFGSNIGTLNFDRSDSPTFSYVISGNGAVTQSGSGTLILSGSNSYTGNTTISSGVLEIGGAGVLGAGSYAAAINTATNTSLLYASSAPQTLSGNITGNGSLVQSGPGTLTLSGANSYSGGTSISGGTLQLSGGDNRLPTTGNLTFSANGTLSVGGNQTLNALTVNGNFTDTVSGAGSLTLSASSFSLGQSGNVTLDLSGLTTFAYNNSLGNFTVGPITSSNSISSILKLSGNSTITAGSLTVGSNGSGPISGSADSPGTITLGMTSTFNSDGITVGFGRQGGFLSFASGLTNPTLTINGSAGASTRTATLYVGNINSGGQSYTRVSTMDTTAGTLNALVGTMIVGYDSRGQNGSPSNTSNFLMGNGTLDATSITIAQAATASNSDNVASTMTIAGGTVTVGALTLGNAVGNSTDTLSGTLNLNTGSTLAAGTIQAGTNSATRTFNWNAGTIENYRGNPTYAETEGNLTINSGLTLTLAGSVNHTFDIDSGFTGTVNAILAGSSGTLVKANGGTLILTASNSYTGATSVSGGTLNLTGSLSGSNITTSSTGAFTESAAGTIGGTGTTFTQNSSVTSTLAGVNSYAGGTTISAGTLQLTGSINTLLNTGTLAFAGNGTLSLGGSQTLNNLTVGSGFTGTVTGAGSLTLNGSSFSLGQSGNVTLDLSGLAAFAYGGNSSSTFTVGPTGTTGGTTATLKLAGANTITAGNLTLGTGNGTTTDEAGAIYLGTTNTINSDVIMIGSAHNGGSISFESSLTNPTLTINGTASASTRTATLYVGAIGGGSGGSGNVTRTSTLDTTAGTLNAFVGTMIVGYDSRTSNGTPPNTSNFLLGNGTLDASSITIAQANTGATGNTVNASMTVTGGTVTVGTLSLGTNQPSGDTLSGTLNLNTGSVLAAAAITPGSGTATRTFNWNDGTIENYRGDATYAETEGNLTISSGLTLTLANTGNHTFNIDPTFTGTVNAIIAGSGGTLVKANGGTLILSGTNSYSGSTTIAGGTLSLAPASGTNNIASSASIIVGAGATLKVADVGGSGANAFALHGTGAQSTSQILGGTGTVSGNVAVASGATLSAGTTPAVTTPNGGSVPATGTSAVVGTLSTGSLGLNGGGDLAIKVGNGQSTGTAFTAGTDFDSIAATGVLNAAGTFTIELLADGTGASSASTNFSPTTSYTFQIASFTGSTNIPNAGATPVILTAGGGKTVTSGDSNIFALDTSSFAAANGVSQTKFYLEEIGGSNGSLDVVYNAAPEPGTALLVVAGAAPIVRARRRRTRSRG